MSKFTIRDVTFNISAHFNGESLFDIQLENGHVQQVGDDDITEEDLRRGAKPNRW